LSGTLREGIQYSFGISGKLSEIAVRLGSQPLRRYQRKSTGNYGFAEEALQHFRKRFQMFKHLLKV
jgi:hypothetical protein